MGRISNTPTAIFAVLSLATLTALVSRPAESRGATIYGAVPEGTPDGVYELTLKGTGSDQGSTRLLARVRAGSYVATTDRAVPDGTYALIAEGGRAAIQYVQLQTGTPGVAQIGHANITGTLRAGKIGVGTNTPLGQIGVATSANVGVHSQALRTGVFGKSTQATGSAYGGNFSSASTGGYGLYGEALSPSGTTYGVFGKSASPAGYGGYFVGRGYFSGNVGLGTPNPATRLDVAGTLRATGLQFPTGAVPGHVLTSDGSGNASWQAAAAPFQLPFAGSTSIDGKAFEVTNTFATGAAIKANGYTCFWGEGRMRVESGEAGATTLLVDNYSGNPIGTGTGAVIRNNAKDGVTLMVQNGGSNSTGRAIEAQYSAPNGFAFFAVGNFGGTGNKYFVIDHPQDPENQYLAHYCQEGPEPRNDYYGEAVLDAQGRATVALPGYYSEINRDPLVFLTAVGRSMPGLYVLETRGNSFRVAGGAPGGRFTWMVSAVRNDRWNRQQPVRAERPKPESLRGTYLQPELYGQPAWRSESQVRAGIQPGTKTRP